MTETENIFDSADTVEEIMIAAIVENECGDPFLDHGCPATILDLVDFGDAAPLAAEELT